MSAPHTAPLIDGCYPEISLGHLETLTDRTGIIQHAIYSIPNRRMGYCTDDNCRALVAAVRHHEITGSRRSLRLVSTYLSFVHYAQLLNGKFHNFMGFEQVFLDGEGSDDCLGRTIWSLGQCLAADIHDNVKQVAHELLVAALPHPETMSALRGRCYSLLGMTLAVGASYVPDAVDRVRALADSVVRDYRSSASPGWEWFEPYLTYSNALMPLALFSSYETMRDSTYLEVAQESFAFLEKQCLIDGMLQVIGCNGWYFKGRERAWFDQQPVDVMMMVLAALAAFRVTGEQKYLELAKISFEWFFGRNALGVPVHDPVTGGCFDGLMATGRNSNQGAESTICCLISQIEMSEYIREGRSLFVEN